MWKILVVDDLPLNVEYLEEELDRLGFKVDTAVDGESALAQVAATGPDLILLDLSLPGIDGIEVIRSLRKDPQHEGLPIILLTASKELDDRIRGLEAGADDYITKPFQMAEVAARINAHLRIQTLQDEVLAREKRLARVEGIGQTLVTLAHHINNATQAISGMAQISQMNPEDEDQHRLLADTALRQTERICAVLDALQQMVENFDLRTTDYAGDPNRMLDIDDDLKRRLKALEEEE